MNSTSHDFKRPVLVIVAAVVIVGALVAGFFAWSSFSSDGPVDEQAVDKRLDDVPDEEEVKKMDVKKEDGDFMVESVGLSMPLSSLSVVNNTINPPRLDRAYFVRDYAKPGDKEHMSVIALHSIKGKDIPGNRLFDIDSGEPTVGDGDEVKVQGHTYVVSKVLTEDKVDASNNDDVWRDEPGKLLIFTCLQRHEGRSVENIIIQAKLKDAE